MKNDECRMMNEEFEEEARERHPPATHRSSFIIHHSRHSRHSRRGISLLEVLISIFIISVGLLGVASLIPAGKLRMVEANKSDRTGAAAAQVCTKSR